jgi:hypothetical protein
MREMDLAQVKSEFNMTADEHGMVEFLPSALG